MRKPMHLLQLLVISLLTTLIHGQKTDTLVIFYKSDQFSISQEDKLKLDKFLLLRWDRISINGYADETDTEDYNLELSKKRSGEVYQYFLSKKIDRNSVFTQFFGETMPQADNESEDGRALNRRTVVIGYQFATITIKPKTDPLKPVTRTLDNGFIVTYSPGYMPPWLAASFEAGSGIDFQLISNTTQMRQGNFYNNTTNGEILSSVLIICGDRLKPCKLDRPIEIKVPIPFKTKCPIEKVKFFNTVAEKGKRIWQEQTKQLYPEFIDGRQYIKLWIDDFCECINFDFKIDPDCFDTDSTKLLYVNANIKNLSAELIGLNSVYMPKKINDSTHSILFLKDKIKDARIAFSLYNGRKRVRSFIDQPLSSFAYDEKTNQYKITTDTVKFYFSRLNIYDVILKVNGDRYKVAPEKNKYEFIYLNRKAEDILVDFTIVQGKRTTQFKNQPLASLPFDETKGYHLIDKKFIKLLKQQSGTIAMTD